MVLANPTHIDVLRYNVLFLVLNKSRGVVSHCLRSFLFLFFPCLRQSMCKFGQNRLASKIYTVYIRHFDRQITKCTVTHGV